jgi:hypothetical protein
VIRDSEGVLFVVTLLLPLLKPRLLRSNRRSNRSLLSIFLLKERLSLLSLRRHLARTLLFIVILVVRRFLAVNLLLDCQLSLGSFEERFHLLL